MSTTHRAARRSAFLLVAALGVASVSCGGGGGDGGTGPGGGNGPAVTRIDLSPTSASVAVGKTATFAATPRDVDGATVTGKSITWSTSDNSVATVSSGVVTGVKPGTVDVIAAVGSVQGKASVTVVAPVATIELAPTTSVVIGGTSQLAATLKDASGNVLTDRTIEWKSDNELVATVSTTGLVTAKSIGTAKITATVEGKVATTTVTVTPVPVASVTVNPTTASLLVGGTVDLSATTKDAAGTVLPDRTIAWSSDNESVATVAANGHVTAHAVGTAHVTATSEGKSAAALITVTLAPVAKVAVSPSGVSVLPGNTTNLTATTTDANGQVVTGRTITWTSSDQSKATVDNNGVVTGVAYGQVTITATSEGKIGTATVKVSDGVAPVLVGLTLVPSPVDVTAGTQTVTATAHITDAGGSGAAQFAITASAPHGAFTDCVDVALDSGTPADGTWSCKLTIPIGAEPGDWKLLVLVSDAGYASQAYSSAELTAAGLPTSFNVVSNWDQSVPVFRSLTVTPTTVNVASGAQTVTVSASLTDNRSGVATFDFVATAASGRQLGCSASAPASGDMLNGTWSCTFTVPADADSGSWAITVRATDRAFNYQTYGPQSGGGTVAFPAGYPTTITVTR